MKKLKVLPGRGLTGKELKARINKRTITGSTYGDDDYMQDLDMARFMKLSKVEQATIARENNKKLIATQREIDDLNKAKDKAKESERINKLAQEKFNQFKADAEKSTTTGTTK